MSGMAGLTPSQTVGPFFHHSLLRQERNVVAAPGVAGERVRLEGRVLDGGGAPVDDAMVEIWQADAAGRYADADGGAAGGSFIGFGRSGTDPDGRFWFDTIKPGIVEGDASAEAPHLDVHVFARGLLDHLVTRVYFEGEPANDHDPVLTGVPPERRGTLVARRDGACYRIDVVLQGPAETVFFHA